MEDLPRTSGEAFDDMETHTANLPSADYLRRPLADDSFIALGALKSGAVVGGIAAYDLEKLEQERSETCIYDLTVVSSIAEKCLRRLCFTD